MFSTLIIRDCALSSWQVPTTVSLKAAPSFPACAFEEGENPHPVADSWAGRGVSVAQGRLELSLLERISEGRIGVTYSAHVVSATSDGSDVTSSLPTTVCLKFAKPQFCRSLAREAWFYEQLADCQGTSIAHYHGFFASTFSEQNNTPDSLLPWNDLDHPCDPDDERDDLPDDEPSSRHYRDTRNFKRDSPWNCWNFSTQDPTISVLVLELLGECCSEHWKEREEPREGLREDIIAVMDDVGVYGLVHDDVTAFNLLCFKGGETSQARCPRHNVIHEWRVIDFDRSHKVDMENGSSRAKRAPGKFNPGFIGASATFWGDCL